MENLSRSEVLFWEVEGLTPAWVIQWVREKLLNCFDGRAGKSLKHWLGMANIFSFLGQWINGQRWAPQHLELAKGHFGPL